MTPSANCKGRGWRPRARGPLLALHSPCGPRDVAHRFLSEQGDDGGSDLEALSQPWAAEGVTQAWPLALTMLSIKRAGLCFL